MRRKDKEITDRTEMEHILQMAMVCRVSFMDGNYPYIIPLNYGYVWEEKLNLYFHSAKEGKKIELIKKNNNVAFEIDIAGDLVKKEKACDWGITYKSIVGKGEIEIIEEEREKIYAMDSVMKHYGFEGKPDYGEAGIEKVAILKLNVLEMTGKGTK